MARRGRLDDWLVRDELDDDDETGATVLMDGSVDLMETSPFGGDDNEDESETVVMGSADARALMDDDEGVLEEEEQTFAPWIDEQETRIDRGASNRYHWVEPGLSEDETQLLRPPSGTAAVHEPIATDPQTTLSPGDDGEDEEWAPSLLGLGVVAGLIVGGLVLAVGLAVVGLLLM